MTCTPQFTRCDNVPVAMALRDGKILFLCKAHVVIERERAKRHDQALPMAPLKIPKSWKLEYPI